MKPTTSDEPLLSRRRLLGSAGIASMAMLTPAVSAPNPHVTSSVPDEEGDLTMQATQAMPFTVDVPESTLREIERRVAAAAWPDAPPGDGWDYGVDLDFLRSLAASWLDGYDWRAQEREMNRFPQFRAEIAGEAIHFVHERGSGSSPQPLLLLHGWPYSFATFLPLIERLAHPEQFGGDANDGFDVIVPSLPGFGFSDRPAKPLGPRAIAQRMDELVTSVLGYDRYLAQGGDWGAPISSWLALDYPSRCEAIHLNSVGMGAAGPPFWVVDPGPGPHSIEERLALGEAQTQVLRDLAYFFQQGTRPLTTAYAMSDSPIGTAAWMLDKWFLWSDRRERRFDEIFSRDRLLTEVMIYLVTATFDTSIWIHHGFMAEKSWALQEGERIETPTGFAAFKGPFASLPPREALEGVYNIVQWSDMPYGGHFPMVEAPDLFIRDLQQFRRLIEAR